MILTKENVEREAVTQAAIERLRKQGFRELEGIADKPVQESGKKPSDLSAMKVDALRKLAEEKGIEGTAALTKAELLELLKDVV